MKLENVNKVSLMTASYIKYLNSVNLLSAVVLINTVIVSEVFSFLKKQEFSFCGSTGVFILADVSQTLRRKPD